MNNNPQNHNYFKEIMKMQESGQFRPATVSEVTVSHQDWCMIFSRGRCNCEPTIKNGQPNRAQRRAQKKQK